MKIAKFAAAVCLAFICSACNKGTNVELTGFIPAKFPLDYNKSTEIHSYKNPMTNMSAFKSVVVQEVKIEANGDNPDEASKLSIEFRNELIAAVGLPVAAAVGPGVLEVRASITGLKQNIPALNIAPQSQMRGRGYGFVACEIYALDGKDGAPVAAYADTQNTQRFSSEKMSDWGSAQLGLKTMADAFGAMLKKK